METPFPAPHSPRPPQLTEIREISRFPVVDARNKIPNLAFYLNRKEGNHPESIRLPNTFRSKTAIGPLSVRQDSYRSDNGPVQIYVEC